MFSTGAHCCTAGSTESTAIFYHAVLNIYISCHFSPTSKWLWKCKGCAHSGQQWLGPVTTQFKTASTIIVTNKYKINFSVCAHTYTFNNTCPVCCSATAWADPWNVCPYFLTGIFVIIVIGLLPLQQCLYVTYQIFFLLMQDWRRSSPVGTVRTYREDALRRSMEQVVRPCNDCRNWPLFVYSKII